MNSYVKAFESCRLTDRQTDRHDRNYIPRRFAGGQNGHRINGVGWFLQETHQEMR